MLLPFIIGSYVLFEVNYFVRVFYTVISSKLRYKKKKYILDEGTSHGICTSTDLDFYWHMNNTRYLREFEFGRTAFGVANGIWKAAKQTGCRGVMSAVSIRYRRSITLFQVFRIKTKIIYWTDRDLYLEQFMETTHDNFIRAVSFNRVTFTGGVMPEAPVRKILEIITDNNVPELPEIKPDLKCWMDSNQLSSDKLRKKD